MRKLGPQCVAPDRTPARRTRNNGLNNLGKDEKIWNERKLQYPLFAR